MVQQHGKLARQRHARLLDVDPRHQGHRDLVLEVLNDPGVTFTTVPANTEGFADFLYRIGAIQHEPSSWRDYFFEDIHDRAGG